MNGDNAYATNTDKGGYYKQNNDMYDYVVDSAATDNVPVAYKKVYNARDDANDHYVNQDNRVCYSYVTRDNNFYGLDNDMGPTPLPNSVRCAMMTTALAVFLASSTANHRADLSISLTSSTANLRAALSVSVSMI